MYSKPIGFDNTLFKKVKTYKLVTTVQQSIIPLDKVYAVYNDKENPIFLIKLCNHNNYLIGYEMEVDDKEKKIYLKYIDKKYHYVFLPTENEFPRVKNFFKDISSGNNRLHDVRNERVYSANAIRSFYIDKSVFIYEKFYDLYCDIQVAKEVKKFTIDKRFLGISRRKPFYFIDEMTKEDLIVYKDQLLRIYPSSKLGLHSNYREIILSANHVFVNVDNDFKESITAMKMMKEDYLDELHNSVEAEQQKLDLA